MQYGFVKVASAVPGVRVADCEYNSNQIKTIIADADKQGVEIVVFPELCITGYSCQDLFRQSVLIEQAESAIEDLLLFTSGLDVINIVGAPVIINGALMNCAVVIQNGKIIGIVPKTYMPNYGEFYEKRWFTSSLEMKTATFHYAGCEVRVEPGCTLFATPDDIKFGVEICEDVWAPVPPSNDLTLAGADIIFNLSASDELIGKHDYLKSLLAQQF